MALLKAILAAVLALPVFHEDAADDAKARQLKAVATAVHAASQRAPRSSSDWTALLLTVGELETHFSLRVHEGRCRQLECDGGRARGPWQQHLNAFTRPVWDQLIGVDNTATQARMASTTLARAYWTCHRGNPDWVAATLNAYAGRRCDAVWPGLEQRLALFRQIRRQL